MHALRLPPQHLWRVTALAALIAIVLTAAILLAADSLRSDGGSTQATGTGAPAPALTPSAATGERAPAWVKDPLAPPTFTLTGGR